MSDPTNARAGATPRAMPRALDQATNPKWATTKITFRGIIMVLSLAASIISFVYISAPRQWSDWILLSPLYGLPYPLLSFIWEAIEITILIVRRDKNKGIIPAMHLACELLLWLGGLIVAILWATIVTSTEQHSSTFTQGSSSGIPASTFKKWAHVIYAWCALNLATVVCQFFIFVVSCIEVDRNRRNMEQKVNTLLAMMEERGHNPSDVLASLRSPPPDYDSTKPSWPIEMPAVNLHPVEMGVDERPMEVAGSQVGQEMAVPGTEDLSGNQKFVLKP
ncbi:hypothetical protein J7T55_004844 [Diaporthe amygdali]|uniref:uncharacterized protein n=1 Tax=Phomopsis amygdali TaxID=1214568 RepID=UPI0022FE6B14|nr:uncharacterized protein J7T55_004844 [Diaporthe amygdali]KAJ0114600.1 hypothetical protein J7T55_004844 [Diaporthe amygdali]